MSVKVLVNKGFYINKDGEKIELNQNSLDIYFKEDFDKLESENRRLKAKLEKCKEQRNWLASHIPVTSSAFNGDISLLDKQLDSIE